MWSLIILGHAHENMMLMGVVFALLRCVVVAVREYLPKK